MASGPWRQLPRKKRACQRRISFTRYPFGSVIWDHGKLSIWMFPGAIQKIAGWFIDVYSRESQLKMDDLGIPLFQETTISMLVWIKNNQYLYINVVHRFHQQCNDSRRVCMELGYGFRLGCPKSSLSLTFCWGLNDSACQSNFM